MSIGFDYGTVSKQNTAVRESPLIWLPGVDAALSIQIDGTGTLASPTMELYENGITDVSSTKLTGAMSISGRVIVCKSFSSLVAGNTYKYYVRFTDSGLSQVREGQIIVPKYGVNPSSYPGALNWWRIKDSPITVYPSQSLSGFIDVDGEGALGGTPTMSAYRGTTDVSSTVLSGSASATGRRITLKTIGSLTAGSYLIYVYFTDGGVNTARYFEIIVPKLGA